MPIYFLSNKFICPLVQEEEKKYTQQNNERSENSFSLCFTLKVTLFIIQNNVCRQGPFEIISYTDEQIGNINGFQKANGGNKIHPEDSEIFLNILKLIFYPKMRIFQTIRYFLHLLNTHYYGTSTLNY